jgi:hypothetical protein
MAPIRILRGIAAGTGPAMALLLAIAAGVPDALAAPGGCRGSPKDGGVCTSGNGNQAPTISGTPSTQATVGESYGFTPTASDPEGKTLKFSIANKPAWVSFNASTGGLSGTPGASAEGEYVDIVIQASDGRLTASLGPFAIVVSGGANQPPSIGGTPTTAAREGQVYEFRPAAADPDGDALGFTIANKPSWASFDSSTGRLRGTPGTGTVGIYRDITIRVSDGTLVATLPAFSITVEQASLGSATLSWTAPTQREDGTALTNLAGYRVRYGNAPVSYPNQVQIANPGITTVVVENLPAGTYYFVATAYDSNGRESEFSGVVSKTI